MSLFVLADAKFRFAESAFKRWKQIWYRLRVVPDVGTGTGAAAGSIKAALPCPETAVMLSKNGRGLQNCQVCRNRLGYFIGQRCIIKTIAELLCLYPEVLRNLSANSSPTSRYSVNFDEYHGRYVVG